MHDGISCDCDRIQDDPYATTMIIILLNAWHQVTCPFTRRGEYIRSYVFGRSSALHMKNPGQGSCHDEGLWHAGKEAIQ